MDGTLNIPLLQDIGVWIDNSEKLPINDIRNIDALTEAQTMPPDLVLERLRKYEKVDGNLGIIIGYG